MYRGGFGGVVEGRLIKDPLRSLRKTSKAIVQVLESHRMADVLA